MIEDRRVHLMLYFFGAGHHTNASDFTILQRFQDLVNILPVIAKADSFKPNELQRLKLDILNTAIERRVRFFDCAGAINVIAEVKANQY